MEWNELKIGQILRHGFNYPRHRFLGYLSIKMNENYVPKPLGITLNVTEKCNLRCKMCYWWKKDLKGEELSEKDILGIIEDMKDWGVNRINLSGGESLLRKNIVFNVLSLCNEYGIETGLVTNGWLLDEKTADQLVMRGLARISISIDGIGNTHDNIRGIKGSYDKAIDAINNLNKSKERLNIKCVVHLNTVVCNENLDELLNLIELAKSLNCIIWFQAFHCYDDNGKLVKDEKNSLWIPKDRLNKLNEILDKVIEIKMKESGIIGNPMDELRHMKKYFEDYNVKKVNCHAAFDALSIDSFGNVQPCWHRKSIRNIKEEGIRAIWESDEYKKTLISMQHCTLPCLLNCHFTPGSLGSLMYDMIYLPVRRVLW